MESLLLAAPNEEVVASYKVASYARREEALK
jgi:hypothetical protein